VRPRIAYDAKEAHRWLSEFAEDDLQRIPLMPPGSRLEANATYLNLADALRGEYTAEGRKTWVKPATSCLRHKSTTNFGID
jgi:hypothetical protein